MPHRPDSPNNSLAGQRNLAHSRDPLLSRPSRGGASRLVAFGAEGAAIQLPTSRDSRGERAQSGHTLHMSGEVNVRPGVLVMDLGLDSKFEASMDAARTLFRSSSAGGLGALEVDLVRTPDRLVVSTALLTQVSVIHVMGHGRSTFTPSILSDPEAPGGREAFSTRHQLEFQRWTNLWPYAHCLLLDACETSNPKWKKWIRRCVPVDQEFLFIGTTSSITWPQATIFTSNFYASLLHSGLTGNFDVDWPRLQNGCENAVAAYEQITEEPCPFEWTWLSGQGTS